MRVSPALSVLLALFAAVGCGESPPTIDGSRPTGLVPGPVTQGLRLSARLEVERGLIRYTLENVGETPFRYTHGHFGDVLEVRAVGETAWQELGVRPDALRIVSGMGPISRDLRVLAPGDFLPRDAFYGVVDQRRFNSDGEARPGLDVPQAPEPFTLDLLDCVWPAALGDLDRGTIELRVIQVHHDWTDLPELGPLSGVRVPSAVFRLEWADVPTAIREQLERGSP